MILKFLFTMAEKLPFGEGASINRPPLCSMVWIINFGKLEWKYLLNLLIKEFGMQLKMTLLFLNLKRMDLLLKNLGPNGLMLKNKKAKFDCITKNIITSALNSDEFFRISQCASAKEMWDTLEVTHEGTNDVKRARKHTLIQEYEMFRMFKGESIVEVQKRFTHIINHLMSLGKTFDKEELNIKILKCLDRSWQPKVTTISESKDLTSLTTVSLFGKLREHELEMNRLNVQESEDKHVRNIAWKLPSTRRSKIQVRKKI